MCLSRVLSEDRPTHHRLYNLLGTLDFSGRGSFVRTEYGHLSIDGHLSLYFDGDFRQNLRWWLSHLANMYYTVYRTLASILLYQISVSLLTQRTFSCIPVKTMVIIRSMLNQFHCHDRTLFPHAKTEANSTSIAAKL